MPSGFGSIPGAARRIESPAPSRRPRNRASPVRTTGRTRPRRLPAARRPAAGIGEEAIAEGLRSTFAGVEHRIEQIAVVRGVRYVNDSKATNVAAALRALASFPGARLHVILGGLGKREARGARGGAHGPFRAPTR